MDAVGGFQNGREDRQVGAENRRAGGRAEGVLGVNCRMLETLNVHIGKEPRPWDRK